MQSNNSCIYHNRESFLKGIIPWFLGLRLVHDWEEIQLAPSHSLFLMKRETICRSTFGHSPCQGDGPNAPVSDAWKLSAWDVHMQLPRYDSLIQN